MDQTKTCIQNVAVLHPDPGLIFEAIWANFGTQHIKMDGDTLKS